MEIKLIKNEIIKNSKRSEKIKFVEISVSKIEEVDIELAEKFIKDIVNFNCRLDFTKETWKDVKEIIVDKYEKAYFVIGHKLEGYEKEIVEISKKINKKFEIHAIIPKMISEDVGQNLIKWDI